MFNALTSLTGGGGLSLSGETRSGADSSDFLGGRSDRVNLPGFYYKSDSPLGIGSILALGVVAFIVYKAVT